MNDIAQELSEIIVVTSDEVPLMNIVKLCGPVRGGTSRAKHLGRDIFAGLKNIVGGEVVGYTELLAEAREEALYRMKLDAKSLGANAVIAFRFTSATVGVGIAVKNETALALPYDDTHKLACVGMSDVSAHGTH